MDGPSHEGNQHTGSLKPDGYIIIQENDLISGFDNTVGIANNRSGDVKPKIIHKINIAKLIPTIIPPKAIANSFFIFLAFL